MHTKIQLGPWCGVAGALYVLVRTASVRLYAGVDKRWVTEEDKKSIYVIESSAGNNCKHVLSGQDQ